VKTKWFADFRRGLERLIRDWNRHHCASHGAAVAVDTLFSLPPVIVLVLDVAVWFVDERIAAGALAQQIRNVTGLHERELIEQVLNTARSSAPGLWPTIVAAVALIYGATTAFSEVKAGLDEIWEIRTPARRRAVGILSLIRARLLSFGLVLVLAVLLLLSLMVTAVLVAIHRHWTAAFASATWLLVIASAFSFVVITILFAIILKVLPDAHIRWRDAWVGAFVTATLITAGKHLIGIYLGYAEFTSYFGAAGSLGVWLLWVYFAALIFFFGAEITRLRSARSSRVNQNSVAKVPQAPAHAGLAPSDGEHRPDGVR
jgi:membrane protein